MDNLVEINSCEVCENKNLEPVLNLGNHPLCDDLIHVGGERICHEYPIEIVFCNQCLTAHQRYQVPKNQLFPKTYHYRSRFTADVLNGMASLVKSCEQKMLLDKKVVLDVGCNDGSLLDFFRTKGCITVGIEPTDAYLDADSNEHHIYNSFLSIETAEIILKNHGHPDIITFTNVFAHIENLKEVLSTLKLLMSPTTLLVIENHYLGSILDGNQFDTFYHEHPRTYSYSSFVEIAKDLGTNIQDVQFPSRYGGNIRIFIGNTNYDAKTASKIEGILAKEQNYLRQFKSLESRINNWVIAKKEIIRGMVKKYGKIPAKAFPGRAAILIKMLNIDESSISCVFEKPGSMKIDHYVPGTRINIKSDDELFAYSQKPPVILNLAWHISDEIKSYLSANSVDSKVIDILNEEDFG